MTAVPPSLSHLTSLACRSRSTILDSRLFACRCLASCSERSLSSSRPRPKKQLKSDQTCLTQRERLPYSNFPTKWNRTEARLKRIFLDKRLETSTFDRYMSNDAIECKANRTVFHLCIFIDFRSIFILRCALTHSFSRTFSVLCTGLLTNDVIDTFLDYSHANPNVF